MWLPVPARSPSYGVRAAEWATREALGTHSRSFAPRQSLANGRGRCSASLRMTNVAARFSGFA
jgi:hypothetical protein